MRKKEIKEKFEKLDEQIKSLEKGQEDLCEALQFILKVIKQYTDEPIYRIKADYALHRNTYVEEFILQYAYDNKIKEITTYVDIQETELFAYCNTHFILKNSNNKYFLVDMIQGTMTNIPAQLLFSKEMNLAIEGQYFKVCQSTSDIYIDINRLKDD